MISAFHSSLQRLRYHVRDRLIALPAKKQNAANTRTEVRRIEAIFSADDFYEKHGEQTVQLTEKLSGEKEKVERLYARWHELEELRLNLT